MMKRMMKAVLVLTVILVMASGYPALAHAKDGLTETQFSQFMKAQQHVDAKAEPDDNAETAFSYDEGAVVYVTGETDDGWYIVFYQGKTGYINKAASQEVFETEEISIEALDEELEALQVNDKIIVEEVERYRAEVRRSRIWGVVIVLLVFGIFVVGIFSTVRAERNKGKSKDDQDILDLDKEEVNQRLDEK